MTDVLFYDVETFSEVPIRNGLDLYSRSCEIMLVQWALGDGPVHVADIRESGWPGELVDHFQNDAVQIVAHNSAFERQVHEHQTDFDIDPTRWRCSMVRALAHSLPAGLDDLCTVLQLGEETAKLKDGKSLIKLFCCPRPKNMKLRRATKDTHPDEWARFLLYANNDITAMRECWKRMPAWNYPNRQLEVDLHHLDQKINQRGLPLDRDLIHGALEEVEAEQARLKDAVIEATDGEVTSGGQRDKLIQYIMESYGVEFVDLRASTLADYLKNDDIPPGLRMLIELRQAASKTSTTKYKRMLQIVGPDGRARNTIQFCGAARTGRDAGRMIQPQNWPSRGLLPQEDIDSGVAALRLQSAYSLGYDVMKLTSSAIRSTIRAPIGKRLCVADLAGIENRMIMWLANENWELQAFEAFDKGEGPDQYKLTYSRAFGVDVTTVSKAERQIGKVQALFLQFKGGVGAFAAAAAGYGIDLNDLALNLQQSATTEQWDSARGLLDWHRTQGRKPPEDLGMTDFVWCACQILVTAWRSSHPATVEFWDVLERTVREAIDSPGRTLQAKRIKVRRDGAWLRLGLPSGRALCYPQPKIEKVSFKKKTVVQDDATQDDTREVITFFGQNQVTRKWGRVPTASGKLAENVTQGEARNVFASSWIPSEEAGYEIIGRVHDELVTEAPDNGRYTGEKLAAIMAVNPVWAPDLPLAAAGETMYWYRK